MTRRLLVSLSSHGFGNAVQTAVVVEVLRQRWPDRQVMLRSLLPRTRLARFFAGPFQVIETSDDIGMLMAYPLAVPAEETAAEPITGLQGEEHRWLRMPGTRLELRGIKE